MSLANEIIYGGLDSLKHYLTLGVDVNAMDEYGFTPLIETAIVNDADKAALILSHGAFVNEKDFTGRTALHWAADNHNLPLCELLLKHKANPNITTDAAQPPLTYALLRKQERLKKLLLDYGADLTFAQDYIRTKLIGHRFELTGKVHIINAYNEFILLDFEGFFLEFSLNIIRDSLEQYQHNFQAKHLRHYFKYFSQIIKSLDAAAELIRYQQYSVKREQYIDRIHSLCDHEPLIIPATYKGHAITFIRFGNLFVKCDRGANSEFEGTVIIYKLQAPQALDKRLIERIIYEKNTDDFMHQQINHILQLHKLYEMPIPRQRTGNCSWANVEATVPCLLFLFLLQDYPNESPGSLQNNALNLYAQWRSWDKDRAVDGFIQRFAEADDAHKASIAAVLCAVLFQACDYTVVNNTPRGEKIMRLLSQPKFRYILQTYIDIYHHQEHTTAGANLMHLLDMI